MKRDALVDYLDRRFVGHCEPEVGAGLNRAWVALSALLQDEMEGTARHSRGRPLRPARVRNLGADASPKDNIGAAVARRESRS
jgi:hypothetical protein